MAKISLIFALLLVALGLLGYISTGSVHPTALIPTWIGLALGIFGFSGDQSRRTPAQSVHAHQCDDCAAGLDRHVR